MADKPSIKAKYEPGSSGAASTSPEFAKLNGGIPAVKSVSQINAANSPKSYKDSTSN